ncbi:uncharacterized protein LOC127001296 [Eriocheir sinensis]|uniref:uncharacterized protein LOC127001296 n=1 Tax=Eriocheir sinensis TaxID=95602 RepID=UPI0021C892D3|nr:uncharacterized protein LOC127001296 [Eriocheir sinensis]
MPSDSEIETSTLMPHAEPRPQIRRPLSSIDLPPVVLPESSARGDKQAEVRESLSDESLRADTPEEKVWTDEGRKWLEFGEAVLKEVWSDARDYLHTSIHPKHGGGDSDSWGSAEGQRTRPPQPPINQHEDATTFFRDGRRRIDYVLVYEDAEGAARRTQEREKTLIRTVSEKRMKKHETWREKFMTSLMKAGLHMEEVSAAWKSMFCYVKSRFG